MPEHLRDFRMTVRIEGPTGNVIRLKDVPVEKGMSQLITDLSEQLGYEVPIEEILRAKKVADAAGAAMLGLTLFASGFMGLALSLSLVGPILGL